MSASVIGLGLMVLFGLAVAVGVVLGGELRHRKRARLDAWSWRLWRWEQEIVSSADAQGCPCCQLLRRRSDLQRSPSSERRDLD